MDRNVIFKEVLSLLQIYLYYEYYFRSKNIVSFQMCPMENYCFLLLKSLEVACYHQDFYLLTYEFFNVGGKGVQGVSFI